MRAWQSIFLVLCLSGTFAHPNDVSVVDLPLIEMPSKGPGPDVFAVILSGDGGWASLDKEVGGALVARGYPVVGLSSLRYFWKARTPDSAAKDLQRILVHYMSAWKKGRAILIGYSYGADVLPFMANRLPPELLAKISFVTLIGLDRSVAFEFHLSEWLGGASHKELQVLPEIVKLKGTRILCICGEEEKNSLCRDLDPGLARLVHLPGSHHFGGNYSALSNVIIQELEAAKTPSIVSGSH
jgi:type IV secretory pathway VirJ component